MSVVFTSHPDSDWAPEQPITTQKMKSLYYNPLGIAAAAPGAPQVVDAAIVDISANKIKNLIVQTQIGSGAIGQGQMKVGTGLAGATLGAGSRSIAIHPGGSWAYSQLLQSAQLVGTGSISATTTILDSSIVLLVNIPYNTITLANDDAGTKDLVASLLFVQASPPYNHGYGDIPAYPFVTIDNTTGEIDSLWFSTEAPWHYNGPTDIRAQVYRNGVGYRMRKDMSGVPFTYAQAKDDPAKLNEYLAAFRGAKEIEQEITQEIKHADMPLIPHPFLTPKPGQTIALLNPVSDVICMCAEMSAEHEHFNVKELISNKYIKLDNTPLDLPGPPSVPIIDVKMR